jgi:hypothetical protein
MPQTTNILPYFPERPRTDSSAVAWYVFVSPLLVAFAVGMFAARFALPAALATAFVLWYRQRRLRKLPQAVLTVSQARLIVTNVAGRTLLDVPLEELDDVALDTKTVQKVQESLTSGVPELRFINSRVGPAIDNSRIELVTLDTRLPLTEFYTSSTDATDWFSRIRRFLRDQGWRPVDEREP